MDIVCAWCEKVIKKGKGKSISHGICAKCAEKMKRQIETRKRVK